MKKNTVFSLAINLCLPGLVHAQALSCEAVLQGNLVNTRSTNFSEVLISQMQSDVCTQTFSSKESVQDYMRSGGWSLNVFDLFDNSLTDSKSQSSGSYSVERTEFCDKSSADLARSFGANYMERNGQFVLRAFEHCVTTTNADILYLKYQLNDYGANQVITGDLVRDTGPRRSSLGYYIHGFSVTPADADVSCKITGQDISDDVSTSNPIPINSSPADLACSKGEDRTVSISIQTSEGAFRVISPSNEEDERLRDMRVLESQVARQNAEISSLNQEITDANATASNLRDQLRSTATQRDQFSKRHRATWFNVYTGDGGWQGRRDIYAPCGTPINKQWGVGQCAAKGMDYWSLKFAGDHSGGHCGHSWFMLLCQAR